MISDSVQAVEQNGESIDAIKLPLQPLIAAMQAVNAGDFSVRLDEHLDDHDGLQDVAREFNQWVSRQQSFTQGVATLSQQVSEGKRTERLVLEDAPGSWATSIASVNQLIHSLVAPTIEAERVLSAIAQGNLSERMALEIDGKPLTGDLLQLGTIVNDLADRLSAFAAEITRVVGKIGREGNLGAVAAVEGASGIWQELIETINGMSTEVTEQVRNIAEVTLAVAQGDLMRRIEAENAGEFRNLTDNINQMIHNLQGSIGQITEIATTVATASEELTAISHEMSDNAGQTSEQATSASASAEQVSQNATMVATAIEEMNVSIREIAKNAAEGAKVGTEAVKTSDQTNATITKLGQSSVEIGKVIKVITSIAQQTNLLALNATIEAARAGEAGRGFAVVANEVKELAKQTAAATEDISQRIEAIQTDTKGAVDAITEITSVINQINDIQNTIASAVEEQTATTNEISRNVSEAARGTSDIARNIGVVAQNAQTTTVSVNNTAQAAVELAQMAINLQTIVSQFRV